ncbi:SRPBCC family protein [Streptomyces antimicrobicus]|uniref:SRPBCC family protein n=1 Tax=Streptomyces antimicrobicus TaxID=2883108 RepID=A0ABS8BF98_9ACTN|nr:SRPBCC family protein [Streptomyces antimicrobicus]MCB5183304.1 SRPBCC family protein [Streptomyces antimicrobicus]
MAVQHRLVGTRPERVWEVLADGDRYARWVLGTHRSREADGRWPQEGSELRYRIKVGPFTYDGTTVVRVCEPPQRLELEAKMGDAGARIAIEVRPWGPEETLLVLDEHPLRGRGWSFHHAAIDAVAQLRHRVMLARLARECEDGARERR